MKKNIIDKEIGFRFTKFREKLNLAQHEMAKEVGRCQASISKIETSKSYPNLRYLKYFLQKYRLNINWIFSGKGEMFIRKNENYEKYKKHIDLFKMMQVPEIELSIFSKLAETKLILKDKIENYKNNSLKNEINESL